MNVRSRPFRLILLSLALTAGRAAADLGCVDDIRKAGPDGSFCHGSSGSHAQAQASASPAAASQLNAMAAGAIGGAIGGVLGNALVAPLANPYQGRKPVKPVVSDDDGIPNPHAAASSAADDILSGYKAKGDSYQAKLDRFRALHDAEMDKRREALELLRGTSAEKWCAAHIGILFPSPPVSDVLNRYPDKVRIYDREKQIWDEKCGGPSAMPGYSSFTDELAALKPDAPAGAATASGATRKAPTYDAAPPAVENEPPSEETAKAPAKTAPEADDELLPTPKTAKADDGSAPAAADAGAPPAAGAASDAAPSPDDSANTNHTTEAFGEKNAKVTAKDLADTRAPELEDHPAAPGSGAKGGGPGTPPSASGKTRFPVETKGTALAEGSGAAHTPSTSATARAPVAPVGKITKSIQEPPHAKKKPALGVADDILDIIKKSPTFLFIYRDLVDQGYDVVYVSTDVGTEIIKEDHVIHVTEDERDDPKAIASSLAHEFGHSRYQNAKPDPKTTSETDYVAASVKDDLADEGEATLVAIKIQRELKANHGPEIEVPGEHATDYQEIYDKYPAAKDRQKARDAIGSIFAHGEQPDGTTGMDYQQFYTNAAEDDWNYYHPKKKNP
jgi:hypothetical protein